MATNETGISQVSQEGDSLRVQGVHEGRRSDFRVSAQDVQALEREGGRKAVMEFFHRSLGAAREDQLRSQEP